MLALGGCASLPGTITYRVDPDADGKHALLICQQSSSETCHFKLGDANSAGAIKYAVPQRTQLRIDLPSETLSFCGSSTDAMWFLCPKQELDTHGSLIWHHG